MLMKREYVTPDLLASITADALFGVSPKAVEPATPAPKKGSAFALGRWFKTAAGPKAAATKASATHFTLDDDWVGGWYARTRLLQAATLARLPERCAGDVHATTTSNVEPGRPTSTVDVLTQVKDFS